MNETLIEAANRTSEALRNPFVEGSVGVTDEELAAQARSGDRGALEILITRHPAVDL